MDKTLNEYDKGMITITIIDNYKNWDSDKNEYKKQKKELTNILMDRLEYLFPGIKDVVVIDELGTPRIMKRYTNKE